MTDQLTGVTVQLGGDSLLDCTLGLEDDKASFARHVGRAYRVRRAIGGERQLDLRPGIKLMVAVHQTSPGSRIRVGFGWRGPPPLPPRPSPQRSSPPPPRATRGSQRWRAPSRSRHHDRRTP